MKKYIIFISILLVFFIYIGATKKITDMVRVSTPTDSTMFVVMWDSSNTDVARRMNWYDVETALKDSLITIALDTSNLDNTMWSNFIQNNQAAGSPAGSNTQIQYNSSGSFAGSANLTWNSDLFNVTGTTTLDSVNISANTFIVSDDNNQVTILNATQNSPLNVKADASHNNIYLEENSGTENWTLGVDVSGDLSFTENSINRFIFEPGAGGGLSVMTYSNPNASLDVESGTSEAIRIYEYNGGEYISFFVNSNGDLVINNESTIIATFDDNNAVGVGTASPDSLLTVEQGTHIKRDLLVDGKITATGGVDPPYVSYSAENYKSIRKMSKGLKDDQVVMQFYNSIRNRFEFYHIKKDCFYTLSGYKIKEK